MDIEQRVRAAKITSETIGTLLKEKYSRKYRYLPPEFSDKEDFRSALDSDIPDSFVSRHSNDSEQLALSHVLRPFLIYSSDYRRSKRFISQSKEDTSVSSIPLPKPQAALPHTSILRISPLEVNAPKPPIVEATEETERGLRHPNQEQAYKGRKRQAGAEARDRRCKQIGCGQPLAETSTSYCKDHVGAPKRCAFEGCNLTTEEHETYCSTHEGGVRANPERKASEVENTGVSATVRLSKYCSYEGCKKRSRGASGLCISHGGGKRCQFAGCFKAARGATSLCVTHGGGRRCIVDACTKSAVGSTLYCIGHGGGKRCGYEGCNHSAEGSTNFCIRHGGGKRCKTPNCNKSAIARTDYCVMCGGGKRCKFKNCDKAAVGATEFCKFHGGGRRCSIEGCNKSAQSSSFLCIMHGGGRPCLVKECTSTVTSSTAPFCKRHKESKLQEVDDTLV